MRKTMTKSLQKREKEKKKKKKHIFFCLLLNSFRLTIKNRNNFIFETIIRNLFIVSTDDKGEFIVINRMRNYISFNAWACYLLSRYTFQVVMALMEMKKSTKLLWNVTQKIIVCKSNSFWSNQRSQYSFFFFLSHICSDHNLMYAQSELACNSINKWNSIFQTNFVGWKKECKKKNAKKKIKKMKNNKRNEQKPMQSRWLRNICILFHGCHVIKTEI